MAKKRTRSNKAAGESGSSDGDQPREPTRSPTMGVGVPRAPTMPQGIFNSLQNVGNVMMFSVDQQGNLESPDAALMQVTRCVDNALVVLDALFETGSPAVHDVVHAKAVLGEIRSWVLVARVKRSGRPSSEPLRVPDETWQSAKDLVSTGRRLAQYWIQLYPDRVSEPFSLDPNLEVAHVACLEALMKLRATSKATRKTAETIGAQIHGGDANSVKKALAWLADHNLVGSKASRGGGSWITEHGQAVLQRRQRRQD